MRYSGLAVGVGGGFEALRGFTLTRYFFSTFCLFIFIMFDCQVLSASSFKSPKNGVTYYNADLFIPSLNFVLPLMSSKSISAGAKGKVVLGYTDDRRALRAFDFIPSA